MALISALTGTTPILHEHVYVQYVHIQDKQKLSQLD